MLTKKLHNIQNNADVTVQNKQSKNHSFDMTSESLFNVFRMIGVHHRTPEII